jgi:hypothetical protein
VELGEGVQCATMHALVSHSEQREDTGSSITFDMTPNGNRSHRWRYNWQGHRSRSSTAHHFTVYLMQPQSMGGGVVDQEVLVCVAIAKSNGFVLRSTRRMESIAKGSAHTKLNLLNKVNTSTQRKKGAMRKRQKVEDVVVAMSLEKQSYPQALFQWRLSPQAVSVKQQSSPSPQAVSCEREPPPLIREYAESSSAEGGVVQYKYKSSPCSFPFTIESDTGPGSGSDGASETTSGGGGSNGGEKNHRVSSSGDRRGVCVRLLGSAQEQAIMRNHMKRVEEWGRVEHWAVKHSQAPIASNSSCSFDSSPASYSSFSDPSWSSPLLTEEGARKMEEDEVRRQAEEVARIVSLETVEASRHAAREASGHANYDARRRFENKDEKARRQAKFQKQSRGSGTLFGFGGGAGTSTGAGEFDSKSGQLELPFLPPPPPLPSPPISHLSVALARSPSLPPRSNALSGYTPAAGRAEILRPSVARPPVAATVISG